MTSLQFVSIPPYHYSHVMDTETNIVALETGPKKLTLTMEKKLIGGVQKMIVIAHNQYCCISNPVMKGDDGAVVKGPQGYFKNRLGFNEYRVREHYPRPFPLYPGEELKELKEK